MTDTTPMTDALNRLFVNAEDIIQKLGDEFTSQVFLRKVIHDQQHAYIDLLVSCQHLPFPFDQAHQKIGRRLLSIAPKMGYERLPDEIKDTNIFLKDTASVVYRKPTR